MEERGDGVLYEAIRTAVQAALSGDPELRRIYRRIEAGTASGADAARFARRAGELYGQALGGCVTEEELESGGRAFRVAEAAAGRVLRDLHGSVDAVCRAAVRILNGGSGLGLRPQSVPEDAERIRGIGVFASRSETAEQARQRLGASAVDYAQHTADESARRNAEFQYRAGLGPRVIRTASAGCCPWCAALAGTYAYRPDMDRDVFRRHRYCRCEVTFASGRRRQDVWTKGAREG